VQAVTSFREAAIRIPRVSLISAKPLFGKWNDITPLFSGLGFFLCRRIAGNLGYKNRKKGRYYQATGSNCTITIMSLLRSFFAIFPRGKIRPSFSDLTRADLRSLRRPEIN